MALFGRLNVTDIIGLRSPLEPFLPLYCLLLKLEVTSRFGHLCNRDNQVEQQAMIDALLNDEVDAFILECAFVEWVTSFNCNLFKVGARPPCMLTWQEGSRLTRCPVSTHVWETVE